MVRTEPAKPAKTLGGSNPVKFVLDTGVARDFTQGPMTQTGGDFDLAIDGTGLLQGPDRQAASATPATAASPPIPKASWSPRPAAPCWTKAAARSRSIPLLGAVTIGKDGIVSQGADPGRQDRPRAPDDLSSPRQGRRQSLPQHRQRPPSSPPTPWSDHQGMLEGSNVQSVVRDHQADRGQRAYESMAKMMDNTAELTRSAVERLGKVN